MNSNSLLWFNLCIYSKIERICVNVTFIDTRAGGDSVASADAPLPTVDDNTLTAATSSCMCPSCQLTFDKMSTLVAHVTLSHGRRSTVRRRVGSVSSARPFRCYRCWKTFTLESKLRLHMLSHAENLKDFKCEVSCVDCEGNVQIVNTVVVIRQCSCHLILL